MKINYLPAVTTLAAGTIYCIFGLIKHLDSMTFMKQLLVVLLLFLFIGSVLRLVLEIGIKKMADKVIETEDGEEENVPDGKVIENISSAGSDK